MTSEEDKKKWCPMVRCVETSEPPANCGPDTFRNPTWARCIGEECAMWVVTHTYCNPDGTKTVYGACGFTHPSLD